MKKSNIVVIGASGNIGMYYLDYLLNNLDQEKYNIIATGTKKEYPYTFYNGKYVQLDICNTDEFNKLPQENVKAVIDFAGVLPAYNEENTDLYIDVNVKGTAHVLEYCKKVSAERIIYTHTWADLNGYLSLDKPLKPDWDYKPIREGDHAIYCSTKICAVELIKDYYAKYGLKYSIFRLPNIYMYSPEKYYLVNGKKTLISYRYLIEKAENGEDLELWGDPTRGKDIIYVKDLCQMIFKAMFVDSKIGIYNAGTGIKTTMKEQIEGIIKVFGNPQKKSKIIYCPEKRNCDNFVMDIENIKSDLGFKPNYDYISYLQDYKKEKQLNRFIKKKRD